MSNKKISQLSAAAPLGGTEVLAIVQGGATKKVSVQDVADLVDTSLPDGGATGQVLAKASDDDGDAEWVDNAGGSGLVSIAFIDEIPFTAATTAVGAYDMDTGDLVLTPNTTGAIPGATAQITITGDDSHDLDLSAFKLLGSTEFDNAAGVDYDLFFVCKSPTEFRVAIGVVSDIDAPSDLPALSTPTLTATASSDTAIGLSWTNVANESSYLLQMSTNGTTWSTINSPAANTTSYSKTGLTASTLYYFRIKAVGDGISYTDSGYGTDSETTQAVSMDAAPTDIILTHATADGYSYVNTSGIWTVSPATGSYGISGKDNSQTLASGTNGHIYCTYGSTSDGSMIFGLDDSNTETGYANFKWGLLLAPGATGALYSIDNGTLAAVTSGYALAVGEYARIKVTGTVVTIDVSTDLSTWTTKHTFSQARPAATVYIVSDFNAASGKLTHPKAVNFL